MKIETDRRSVHQETVSSEEGERLKKKRKRNRSTRRERTKVLLNIFLLKKEGKKVKGLSSSSCLLEPYRLNSTQNKKRKMSLYT
jgi:hypothetical protein